ncbi:hypothetical protein FACS1894216_06550 [Synergistales bacterium]|nr:hypothetical protein FACS1894216_06550 [Synergistales bacterium]
MESSRSDNFFGEIPSDAIWAIVDLLASDAEESGIDTADLRCVIGDAKSMFLAAGLAYGENKAVRAAENALREFAARYGEKKIKILLFSIRACADFGIDDMKSANDVINRHCEEDAATILAYRFDPELDDAVRVTLLFSA